MNKYLLLAFSAMALSCTGTIVEDRMEVDVTSEATVPVSLKLEAQPTKSIISSNELTDIKNLWVIQYDGYSEDSKQVGVPTYVDGEALQYGESSVEALISLVPMKEKSTVFFIANSFNSGISSFPQELGTLVTLSKSLSREEDLLGSDGTNHYPMYSCWSNPETISTGSKISGTLSHNIAKVKITVVNDSYDSDPKLTVKGVKMVSVPASSCYFPTYGNPTIFPGVDKLKLMDYETKAWPSEKTQGSASVSHDFEFYLPVNKRGSIVNSVPSLKLAKSPDYATRIVVECSYHDEVSDTDIPVEYTICPGANLTDNFDIESNHSYAYTVKIKDRGDASLDPGIKDFGTVDYSRADVERANCYILNPPETEGYWRTFLIPVDRVNFFWGYNNSFYENVPENTLSPSTPWEASVIWSEFTTDSENFRFTGGGTTYEGKGLDPIKVQIPYGARGNVLIGIRRTDIANAPILWSWHLWITDYNPDEGVKGHTILPGKYEYPVPGGYINRLGLEIWESGYMAGDFIMDRNLGAMDRLPHKKGDVGIILYEHGRKDPFSVKAGFTKKRYDDSALADTEAEPTRAVRYSIAHPNVFIYGSSSSYYWTFDNKYVPVTDHTFLWNDPYAGRGEKHKSIFDPCPSGWSVPEKLMREVSESTFMKAGALTVLNDNEWTRNFFYTDRGRTFGECVYFPMTGRINYSTGNYIESTGSGHLWESSTMEAPTDEVEKIGGSMFSFSPNEVSHYNAARTYGDPVRCVSIVEKDKYK